MTLHCSLCQVLCHVLRKQWWVTNGNSLETGSNLMHASSVASSFLETVDFVLVCGNVCRRLSDKSNVLPRFGRAKRRVPSRE